MTRTLFPPTLKTVSFPTWSADGNINFKFGNDEKLFRFAEAYHWARAVLVSGYFSVNSFSRLRVITCMGNDTLPLLRVTRSNNSHEQIRRHRHRRWTQRSRQ